MISAQKAFSQAALALALVSASGPAVAGTSGAAAQIPLSPREAAQEALRTNPELRAAYQAIEVARGRLAQAGLWPNPELSFAGADDFAFNAEGERAASVGFAQEFPVAGRLARAREVARVDVARALAEAREFERSLIGNVQRTVVALLSLDRAIAAQSGVIEAARTLAQASAARFRLAEVSEADVNLLEIELARLEQERRLLELERTTEGNRLHRLLNRPPNPSVRITGDLDASLLPSDAQPRLTEEALRRRPDLEDLRLAAHRAQAEARLARAQAWGDWTVGFDYEFDRQVFRDEPASDPIGIKRDDFLRLAITIPLPLFDRKQGRIAAARAEQRRARALLSARERVVQMEIATQVHRVDELTQVASQYRDRIVPRATRNVKLLEQGYLDGLVGIAALVQAEQQYAAAAVRYARTLGDLRQAEIDLETAAAASPLLGSPLHTGGTP